MTPEQMKSRLALVEDAIGQIHQRMIVQEGRAYAFQQALLALIEVLSVDPKIFAAVHQYLHEGRVEALNSTEPEIKVNASDHVSVMIIGLMDAAAKRDMESKPVDKP